MARARVGKVAKGGNSRRDATGERKNSRENQPGKVDFAHQPATLRAARSTTYYGQWPAKTAAKTGQKIRANAHNESLSRGYPQASVQNHAERIPPHSNCYGVHMLPRKQTKPRLTDADGTGASWRWRAR
jgi:hypothetical protein